MAARKKKPAPKNVVPKSFAALVKPQSKEVQQLAKAIRKIIIEELSDPQESFYGGRLPMAMYRTSADVCWLQPLKQRCNVYFMRGPELTDPDGLLEGSSDRTKHLKIKSADHLAKLPVRDWLRESVELNQAAVADGMSFDEVLERLRAVCLELPKTKETMTWGKPHFRVGEKIFCGCGEEHGCPKIGLKMDADEANDLMIAPGVQKAPYSRPNDGWVQIDPLVFDDWDEIEQLVVGSFRIIAPKRVSALIDD